MLGRSLPFLSVALMCTSAFSLGAEMSQHVEEPASADQPAKPAMNWPMFRGKPAGHLPESEPGEGVLAWKKQLGRTIWSSPAVSGDHFFITSDIGRLFRLGIEDGTWHWSALIGSKCDATPIVTDDLVIVGTRDGYLAARDVNTGEACWAVSTEALIHASAAAGGDPKQIVFADASGGMGGVTLDGQQLLWQRSNGVPVLSSPVLEGNMLYAAAGKAVFALDLQARREQWMAILNSGVRSSVCVSHDLVLAGCEDGVLVALSRANGTKRWQVQTDGQVESTPAVRDATVYFGSHDGKLRTVRLADGQPVWEAVTHGPINSSPAVTPGHVVIGSWDRHVYCFDRADGQLRWRVEVGGRVASSPAVVGGVTIVGCGDGYVYAIR